MYVACPSCKALYSISDTQLQHANGLVRCGRCRFTFNARLAAADDPRRAPAFEPPLEDQVMAEIDALVDRALVQVPSTSSSSDNASESLPKVGPTAVEPVGLWTGKDCYAQPVADEFVSQQTGAPALPDVPHALLLEDEAVYGGRPRWGAIAAVVFLALALGVQYAWWDRNQLAESVAWRPALDWVCERAGCELPLRHDFTRVEMVGRDVRDNPQVPDALTISAAFINRAPFPQAYPVLQISFSDVAGTPVAVRRFMPEEYLRDKNPARGMAPGEQTLVMLEIADPGARAVSFQFDFM
jgi:predicted Zn finger-like uncharacterized protein